MRRAEKHTSTRCEAGLPTELHETWTMTVARRLGPNVVPLRHRGGWGGPELRACAHAAAIVCTPFRARVYTRAGKSTIHAAAHDHVQQSRRMNACWLNVGRERGRDLLLVYTRFMCSPPLPPPTPTPRTRSASENDRPSVTLRHSPRYRALVHRSVDPSTSLGVSSECTASSLRVDERCD